MIAPFVAGVLLTAQPLPDIAYVARYYYPYPDKRISRFEVYVSDIHGKSRRQISQSKLPHVGELQWVSDTKIQWVEDENLDKKRKVYEYDFTTGRRRSISKLTALPQGYDDMSHEGLYRADSREFPIAYNRPIDSLDGFTLKGLPEIRLVSRYKDERGRHHLIYEREGKKWNVYHSEAFQVQCYRGRQPNTDWMVIDEMHGTAGAFTALFFMDWSTEKQIRIANDCIMYQLSADERVWMGFEGGRPLSKWGPEKQVWSGKIFAGVVGGKRWAVTPGLVFVVDGALRPGFELK